VVEAFAAVPRQSLLAIILVLWPLVVLVHEAGHAAAALVLTRGPVTIRLGGDQPAMKLRAWRVAVSIDLPGVWLGGGVAGWRGSLGRASRAAITFAGPLATLVSGAVAAAVAASIGPERRLAHWCVVFAFQSLLTALVTLTPVFGERNDGSKLLAIWRETSDRSSR
jgi:Peptidase M50B-like